MSREIVKVQRPLAPPDGPWLVYDRKRQRKEMVRPSRELVAALGQDLKGYFYATHTGRGWAIGERAPVQGW